MKETITLISLLAAGCTNATASLKKNVVVSIDKEVLLAKSPRIAALPHNKELPSKAPDIAVPKVQQYDNYGRRIVFVEAQHKFQYLLELFHIQVISSYTTGNPTIMYDAISMRKYPKEYQTFRFFHEVGHFKLGHFGSPPDFTIYYVNHDILPDEYDADCYSMRYLKEKLQYTPKQLDKVLDSEKNNHSGMPSAREGLLECLVQK